MEDIGRQYYRRQRLGTEHNVQNALAPLEIRKINVSESEEEDGRPTISIVVEDEDYGVVLGKKGMNTRLCGRLINATLEVQKMSDYTRIMEIQRNSMVF